MATMFRHTSLVKGVTFDKGTKRWVGRFTLNGQRHYVGTFEKEADAAKAVNQARVDAMGSNFLREEVKDLLKEEKAEIERNARWMSPLQDWHSLPLRQIKDIAEKRGINDDDIVGDKRIKQNWIDVLNSREIRPMTAKEPEVAASIEEIEGLLDYLDKDIEEDRQFSDAIVLDIPQEEWSSCVVTDPSKPSYFWCIGGFLYTLYPTEGYTVWRYDTDVPGNYKPIGVWNPNSDEDGERLEPMWEVNIDKEAGNYCKIKIEEELEEGEISENWVEGAVISPPLSLNGNEHVL
mgnify:CR=1 FL=1